jgi:hypothetical protein
VAPRATHEDDNNGGRVAEAIAAAEEPRRSTRMRSETRRTGTPSNCSGFGPSRPRTSSRRLPDQMAYGTSGLVAYGSFECGIGKPEPRFQMWVSPNSQ